MFSKIFKKKSSSKSKQQPEKIASQTLAGPLNFQQSNLPISASSNAVSSARTGQNFAETRAFSRTTADVTTAGDETDDELESGVSDDDKDFYTCAPQPPNELFPDYASVTLIRRSAMSALKPADDTEPTSRVALTKGAANRRQAESRSSVKAANSPPRNELVDRSQPQKTALVESAKVDGKETFELAIMQAIRKDSCDVLVARHYFASLSVDLPTYCDECNEQIWGLCRAALRCIYCNLTVHPGCAACVQFRCPLSRIDEDLPKLGVTDAHTLTLRRVPKVSPNKTLENNDSANEQHQQSEVKLRKPDRQLKPLQFPRRGEKEQVGGEPLSMAIAGVTLSESTSDDVQVTAKSKAVKHVEDVDESEQFFTAQSDELRAAAASHAAPSPADGDCYIVEDDHDLALNSLSPSVSLLSDSELCPFPSLLEFNPLTGQSSAAHSNANSSTEGSLTGDERNDTNNSPKLRTFARSDEPSTPQRRLPLAEPTTPVAVPHYAFSTLDTQSIKRFDIRITELRGAGYNTMSAASSSADSAISSYGSQSRYSQTVKLTDSHNRVSNERVVGVNVASGTRPTSSTSSTMTGSCSTVVQVADWVASISRERLTQLLAVYNANLLGFSAQSVTLPSKSERQLLVAGFVRVYVNLIRPIKLNLSARPTTIYDLVDLPNGVAQDLSDSPDATKASLPTQSAFGDGSAELRLLDFGSLSNDSQSRDRRTSRSSRTATDKLSTFYLPRGTMKVLHIGSRTTTYDVISCLLNKFHIRDNPRKFALYEHTVEGPHDVTIRKFLDGECPLVTCLQWVDMDAEKPLDSFLCTLQKKRLVIQENESGDVDWEAFSVPELNNFLAILQREEDQRMREIAKKYKMARKQALKRLRHLEKRQAATAAATS